MSVYKEGYSIVEEIEKLSQRIYPDACDYGVPVTKGDRMWNAMNQLTEWYGEKETRKVARYSTGVSVEIEIVLMDEWAVSDRRKSVTQATDKFLLQYTSCRDGLCKGKDGFITITKMN